METTYIIGAPHVHLHYMFDDDNALKMGYGVVEFCCHGCEKATVVAYRIPPPDLDKDGNSPSLKKFRADFETEHRPHQGIIGDGYKVLCPPARAETNFADFR